MKFAKWFALVCAFLSLVVSCDFSGKNSTFTKISFSYRQLKRMSNDSDIKPNEIIYREIEGQNAPLLRKPPESGENSLMLIKGKNYLVGFIYNPNMGSSEIKALPYTKVIGGLEVVNSNLSWTIPTTLETEVTLESFASMVGYSPQVLESYGIYDDSLLK